MNQLKRRLSVVVLALVLLALPAAAQAHPATGAAPAAGEPASWSTVVFDFLAGLLDGLWSVGAASETGTTGTFTDDSDAAFAPRIDPNGGSEAFETTTGFAPRIDPNG